MGHRARPSAPSFPVETACPAPNGVHFMKRRAGMTPPSLRRSEYGVTEVVLTGQTEGTRRLWNELDHEADADLRQNHRAVRIGGSLRRPA